MVITTSEASTASVVSTLGCWSEMSMPTSRIASTAAELIWSAGSDPAERTSTASPARWRSQPRPSGSGRRCARTRTRRWACQTWVVLHFGVVGRSRRGSGGLQLGKQSAHALVDLGPDGADLPRREAGGIADLPVEVALAGID